MSNQSGITASDELHGAFREFIDSPNRALIVHIEHESCKPHSVVPVQGNFESDFDSVRGKLTHNEARYILYRRDDGERRFVFIAFVPDAAPVRSKMLYASSANTLHRELGGHERFGSTLFWTDLDEVSAKGWHSHIAHENAPAPKTEDEQSLEDIAEVEAKQMGTLNVKSHVLSSTVSLPVNEDATAAIKQLAQSAGSAAAALHIDLATETVVVGKIADTLEPREVAGFIHKEQSQYTLYKWAANDDGAPKDAVAFIYTCPSNSKIKERMVYATMKRGVVTFTNGILTIDKVLEASSGDDVTRQFLFEELYGVNNTSNAPSSGARFAKPKRPGRR